jgi:hypothetical protein
MPPWPVTMPGSKEARRAMRPRGRRSVDRPLPRPRPGGGRVSATAASIPRTRPACLPAPRPAAPRPEHRPLGSRARLVNV